MITQQLADNGENDQEPDEPDTDRFRRLKDFLKLCLRLCFDTETDEDDDDDKEVLIDTSAIFHGGWQAHVFPGEEPVNTPTIVAELADVSTRTGMFMPSAIPSTIVPDSSSALTAGLVAAAIRGVRPDGTLPKAGDHNDAIIGATAIGRGIPLVSDDGDLSLALETLGTEVRRMDVRAEQSDSVHHRCSGRPSRWVLALA